MPRAHRLPVVRLCLPFLTAALLSVAVLALVASADPSRAVASQPAIGLSVVQSASKQPTGRKSSSTRRAECVAAARTKKARRACALEKAKRTKPSASPAPAPVAPPSVVVTSVPAPAIADPPPAEALAVPAPESTPPAGSPGGSTKPPAEPPVETKPPVELKAPIEPISPVEESKPPVEESKAPVEEVKAPVEEAKPPVEEPTPPVEESKPPVEEVKAPVEEATPPVEEPKPPVEESKSPVEEAKPPVEEPTPPVEESKPPVEELKAPVEEVKVPVEETKPPVEESKALVEESKAPVEAPPPAKASTTTTLASSTNPSTVGQAVTYTATVSAVAATGTVEFKDGGVVIPGCADRAVGFSGATCTVAGYAAAGAHSITATYSGDGNYLSSTSSTLIQTILSSQGAGQTQGTGQTASKQTTTTVVSSSLDPSVVGQSVTYTATVSSATATGTVAFDEAGKPIVGCSAQPVGSGTATCAVAGLGAGGHWITAVYSGDSNYGNSTSLGFTQTVNRKVSSTIVSSSLNPSMVGEAVTYTATVSPASATGSVEFKQAGVAIAGCSARPVSSGTATCAVTGLGAGGHWVTAVYSGDGNYAVSTFSGFTQTVNRKVSSTTVSSSLNPSMVGEAVTYTATVSSAAATGTVAFAEAGKPIAGCTAQPVSSGAATCTVTGYPSWSSYTVTATYSGDSSYLTSVSPVFTQAVEPPAGGAAPSRFFSPTSFWNEQLPANAPLDPSSTVTVGALDEEIGTANSTKKGQPTINTTSWSVPVYTVSAEQPTIMVKLYNASQNLALQSAWDAVPLPANAQPAAGTDKHLVVWQPSTDRLWEFWRLEKTDEGWQADWGGAIEKESSDSGAYGPEAWAGAKTNWGASASSLSIAGGLITLEDLEKGQINHALAMALPDVRAGAYASPAEQTDGESTSPSSLPEGAHLRLDPSLDLASLHLPKLTLMMAEAAQRYGIVVRDYAENVAFFAQDPTPTGTNPYAGAHGYYEGKSSQQILEAFPWSHLQLLKMELHS
jgi:Bacterial Ig-like domain (group 3)